MMMFVCISAFGAAMGTVFAASRMIFSAARDGQLPACLSEVSESRGTPIKALLLQWSITCFYLFIGNFDELIGVFGSATWFFYFLTVLGMLLLRRWEPTINRPYRAPFLGAVLFCLAAIGLVIILYVGRPLTSSVAFGFILLGLPFYWVYQRGACCRRRSGWSSVEIHTEEKEGFGDEALDEGDWEQVDVDDREIVGEDMTGKKKKKLKDLRLVGGLRTLLGRGGRKGGESEAEVELLSVVNDGHESGEPPSTASSSKANNNNDDESDSVSLIPSVVSSRTQHEGEPLTTKKKSANNEDDYESSKPNVSALV